MHSTIKALSGYLIATIIASSLVAPMVVYAQITEHSDYACAIDAFPYASMESIEELETGELLASIRLNNPSSYIFYDLGIVVAFYDDADALVPSYWAQLEETGSLPGERTVYIDAALDGTQIPAGEYIVRAFTSQGDFDNLLSRALTRADASPALAVEKTTPKSQSIDVAITVNEEPIGAAPLSFDDFTQLSIDSIVTNNTNRPIRDLTLETVVAEGSIPAGTAISYRDSSDVRIIPGSRLRATGIDQSTASGEYTLYSVINQPNVLHELQRATMVLGYEPGRTEFMQLSGVGVQELETGGVEVVACVQRLGGDEGPHLYEEVVLNASTGDVKAVTGETPGRTLRFLTAGDSITAGLTIDLDVPYATLASGEVPEDESFEVPLETKDSISLTYECYGEECEVYAQAPVTETTPAAQTDEAGAGGTSSFTFYAGIVIAAALLGFIMIRRLHPDSNGPVMTKPDQELQ